METGDGVRAWLYLRRVEDYEAAWRAHDGVPAVLEPGPFPIRIQSPADLKADRFNLLAWADPHDAAGPASPFWAQPAMVEGVIEPEAPALVPYLAAEGGAAEGLRLTDGRLVIKIEYAGAMVQVRIRGPCPFPEDGGIKIQHEFGLKMPHTMGRMLDFWNAAGLPAPRSGRGRGGGGGT